MNNKYKVIMVASLMVAGLMLSTNLLAADGKRKVPSEGNKVACKEKMEQCRTDEQVKNRAEWKRISELPEEERAEARAKFKAKLARNRAENEKQMQNCRQEGKKDGVQARRGVSEEQRIAARKSSDEKHRAEMKSEWKRISQLPEEEQEAARKELRAKHQKMRMQNEKDMQKGKSGVKSPKDCSQDCPKELVKMKPQGQKKPEAKSAGPRQENRDGVRPSREEQEKKLKEIEAKIEQLPPKQQEQARVNLQQKKQMLRKQAQQNRSNVTVEDVNKLIDAL